MRIAIRLLTALPGSLAAADTLFPMPSVPDVTDGDRWFFALGAGAEYEAEYDGADDDGFEAEPGLVVQ
jgi:hypothetical protein